MLLFINVSYAHECNPPSWILGQWHGSDILNDEDDFFVIFESNNIIWRDTLRSQPFCIVNNNGPSLLDITASKYSQTITEFYFEIYIEYKDGSWFRERFSFSANGEMLTSELINSYGEEAKFKYYRN